MRIGVLRLSLVGVDKEGQYNAQFLGVSKALDKHFDEVIVYKHIYKGQRAEVSRVDGCRNTTLHLLPVKNNIGINGLVDLNALDNTLDAFLLFSDIQVSVPTVYKWAKQHNIIFLPYVGVLESHSNNAIKRIFMKLFASRAVAVYKKSGCIAKTPEIKDNLISLGVKDIRIMPAGLDMTLVHQSVTDDDVKQIRERYGYKDNEKIILFVGRMEREKNPILMIKIFKKLVVNNPDYRLIMVGSGMLEEEILQKISELKLEQWVTRIRSIPNNEMWKLYSISDSFVNLNQQEIFGMAILEAMLYGTKVVAWHAPGPDYIIEEEVSGLLCNSEEEIVESICNKEIDKKAAKTRVLENFTWDVTSKIILETLSLEENEKIRET